MFVKMYVARLKLAMQSKATELRESMTGDKPRVFLDSVKSPLRTVTVSPKDGTSYTECIVPAKSIAIAVDQTDALGNRVTEVMKLDERKNFATVSIYMGYGWTQNVTHMLNINSLSLLDNVPIIAGFCPDGLFEQVAAPAPTTGESRKRVRQGGMGVKQEPDVPAMPAGAKVVKTEPT